MLFVGMISKSAPPSATILSRSLESQLQDHFQFGTTNSALSAMLASVLLQNVPNVNPTRLCQAEKA